MGMTVDVSFGNTREAKKWTKEILEFVEGWSRYYSIKYYNSQSRRMRYKINNCNNCLYGKKKIVKLKKLGL